MAKFDPAAPRASVTFQCRQDKHTFDAAPARIAAAPELEHHPFRYFALCPKCGDEVEQAPWDRALQKAWTMATGPKTAAGKAAVAANVKGHPTAEEAQRTRFNAMKTGVHAKTARYFPAKPDGYSFCKTCDVDRDWCAAQPACSKQTEIFMLHHAAFEQRDPAKLQPLYADMQAALFSVLQQIIQTIIVDGVKIETPEYYTDKDGAVVIAQYYDMKDGKLKTLMNLEAHPLFRPLGEMLSRANLSLSDMGMTVKVIEHQEDELGHLAGGAAGARETLDDYRRRQELALADLSSKLDRGQAATNRDPVLLEYHAETGTATPVPK